MSQKKKEVPERVNLQNVSALEILAMRGFLQSLKVFGKLTQVPQESDDDEVTTDRISGEAMQRSISNRFTRRSGKNKCFFLFNSVPFSHIVMAIGYFVHLSYNAYHLSYKYISIAFIFVFVFVFVFVLVTQCILSCNV